MAVLSTETSAHVFVAESFRVGAYPPHEGTGWRAEVFLNLPNSVSEHLLQAEDYVATVTPDFSFQSDWIDFPAGPVATDLDENFSTMGDFFNDYITDVSVPAKLDEPFGNFLVRFSGYLKVTPDHDSIDRAGTPVWVDFGTIANDGYRLLVGTTIYRFPFVTLEDFFWRENPIVEMPGLYRIQFTYFNRYDPEGEFGAELAGVELYSWHGGGLALPNGDRMIHPYFGSGTIVPPRVIYRRSAVQPIPPGDYNADTKVNLRDWQHFQSCFTGPGTEIFIILNVGCHNFDFENDIDVDLVDFEVLQGLLSPQ